MKICDSHNDFLTEIKAEKEQIKYIRKLKNNGNIKKIACVVWTTKLKKTINTILNIKKLFFKNQNKKLILCLEDLGFINKKNYVDSLNKIITVKPFSCGLVWNDKNSLGGGAFSNSGLTSLGIYAIRELEKNNILIDTAHMNFKTFWQFTKITTKPIYNSHCNLMHFKNNKRNLNNNQIKYIVDSNGFIGLSFVQTFISNDLIDSQIVAKQIAYFVKKFGDSNIGIGSDFYGTKNLPADVTNYNQFANLKKALKNEGLDNKTIKKVMYKNYYNFVKKFS